jgi:TrmH family RNA methyltransferase
VARRLRSYKKTLPHTYALGVAVTIELLTHRPEDVTEVVICQDWEGSEGIRKILDICAERDIEVIVSDRTLARIGSRSDCWAAAVFRKFSAPLAPEADHVVLVEPANMGNAGTIIRTMLAHRLADLAVTEPACDLFDPRVVRASAGAIAQTRLESFGAFEDYLACYPRTVYCLMSDGETPLPRVKFRRPFALVFGPEGPGLPERFREVGMSLRIPQSDAVDSLNLAVAAGIALYAATQQRA